MTPTPPANPSSRSLETKHGDLAAKMRSEAYRRMVAEREADDKLRRELAHRDQVATRRAALWKARGRRYRHCTLTNFEAVGTQVTVRAAVRDYLHNLTDNIRNGVNLILIGPKGTGKDHLLAAMFDETLDKGFSIKWTSGAALWSRFRSAIDQDRTENQVTAEYITPDVLALSDPVPVCGALTPYQAAKLYEIVDARYNHCRPIWTTVNCQDGSAMAESLGGQVVDRIRDGAVSLACNWGSFRESRK